MKDKIIYCNYFKKFISIIETCNYCKFVDTINILENLYPNIESTILNFRCENNKQECIKNGRMVMYDMQKEP